MCCDNSANLLHIGDLAWKTLASCVIKDKTKLRHSQYFILAASTLVPHYFNAGPDLMASNVLLGCHVVYLRRFVILCEVCDR